jgi:hypothetical protein
MTPLVPDAVGIDAEPDIELELLIREARRRQRRRRLVIGFALLAAVAVAALAQTEDLFGGSQPARSASLFPALGPHGRCPVSSGYWFQGADFVGPVLGHGPVRVLIGNRGDVVHGRVDLGATAVSRLAAIETIWFAMPGYNGPFVVRGARLGRPGPIEVQPGDGGLSPGSGPLVVPAGGTNNTFADGYRTMPGSTWIRTPGCYAYHVTGRGFSENIVFDAAHAR